MDAKGMRGGAGTADGRGSSALTFIGRFLHSLLSLPVVALAWCRLMRFWRQ